MFESLADADLHADVHAPAEGRGIAARFQPVVLDQLGVRRIAEQARAGFFSVPPERCSTRFALTWNRSRFLEPPSDLQRGDGLEQMVLLLTDGTQAADVQHSEWARVSAAQGPRPGDNSGKQLDPVA